MKLDEPKAVKKPLDDFFATEKQYKYAIVSLKRKANKHGRTDHYKVNIRYEPTNQTVWYNTYSKFNEAQETFDRLCEILKQGCEVMEITL